MLALIRPALVTTLFFTLLLGVAYPLAVTGLGQLAFPAQAAGSLVRANGQIAGSSLIAQGFSTPQYFHPRPSAAGANGYDASASSGSNLGPLNADLASRVGKDAASLRAENASAVVPADAVTTSGSGLDPDVSPANAAFQAPRIAKARGISTAQIAEMIAAKTQGRWLGVFGQPRVNVLALNLALDARYPMAHPAKP
jgi:K+-transporting ATPase ATPase C chain